MRDDGVNGAGFHYSREERLRMGGHDPEETRSSSIWGNRTLLIIFLDVILILIIFGVANVVLPLFSGRTTIDGNLFRIRGVQVEETILATLVVVRESADPPQGPGIFTVRFGLEGADGKLHSLSDRISDSAPVAPEERRVVRHEIHPETLPSEDDEVRTVVAVISYGQEEVRLSNQIVGEP